MDENSPNVTRIAFVGNSAVGKSSLLRHLLSDAAKHKLPASSNSYQETQNEVAIADNIEGNSVVFYDIGGRTLSNFSREYVLVLQLVTH